MTNFDPEIIAARLEKRMADGIADARIGSAGIYVMRHGKVLYKKYYGEDPFRCGDHTLFRLASMSKPVTAAAALIQVGKGLLSLDEPVEKHLPAFAQMKTGTVDEKGNILVTGKAETKLTLRHLLSHSGGIGSLDVGAKQRDAMTPEEMQDVPHVVDCISRSLLAFEPGSAQSYSPVWAFDVVARLIELTSGMDFYSFLKKNIFEPCHMPDTTFAPTAEQWSRMVPMHQRTEENGSFRDTVYPMPEGIVFSNIPTTWHSGGAGLASTLPDYVKFAEMLRLGGVTQEGVRILPGEYIRLMGTPQVPESIMPGCERWGLGVRVTLPDHYLMPEGCFGWSGAYGGHFWIDPGNGLAVVMMRNSVYDGGSGSVAARHLEADVYGAVLD